MERQICYWVCDSIGNQKQLIRANRVQKHNHQILISGSGYWGICRHPNYVCEILIFLCFSMFQGTKVGSKFESEIGKCG